MFKNRPDLDPKNNIVMRFFIFNTVLAIATSFQGVYISTLLQRSSGRQDIVLLFNCFNFVLIALVMTLGSFLLQKLSVNFILRLGIFLHMLVYGVVLLRADQLFLVMPLVSLLFSAGAGMYGTAYNVVITQLTKTGNRDSVLGLFNVGGSAVGLSVPLIMGFVISFLPGYSGYYTSMILSLLLGVGILFFGKTDGLPDAGPKVKYRNPVSVLFTMGKTSYGRRTMLLAYIRCVRESSVPILLSLLLFSLLENEAVIGVNNTLAGLLSVAASALYSRFMTPVRRPKSVMISSLSIIVSAIPMFFFPTAWAVLLVSAVNGFMGVFMGMPGVSVEMEGLEELAKHNGISLSHSFAAREYVVMLGRLSGVLVLAVLSASYMQNVIAIIGLILTQLLLVLFLKPKPEPEPEESPE